MKKSRIPLIFIVLVLVGAFVDADPQFNKLNDLYTPLKDGNTWLTIGKPSCDGQSISKSSDSGLDVYGGWSRMKCQANTQYMSFTSMLMGTLGRVVSLSEIIEPSGVHFYELKFGGVSSVQDSIAFPCGRWVYWMI